MKQLVVAGLVLIMLQPVPEPQPRKFTAEFHIFVQKEDSETRGVATPSESDVGLLDAALKAGEAMTAGPDIIGQATADLVCKAPGGKRRYYAWGSGNSKKAAIEDAMAQVKKDLK